MRISLVAAAVDPLFQLSGTFGTCLETQHLFNIHLRVPSLLNSNISPCTVTCSSVRVKKRDRLLPSEVSGHPMRYLCTLRCSPAAGGIW